MLFLQLFKKAAEAIANFASNLLKSLGFNKPKPQQPTDFGITSTDSNLVGNPDSSPKQYKSDEELAQAVANLPTYKPKQPQPEKDELQTRFDNLTEGKGWDANASLKTKVNRIQEMQKTLKQQSEAEPKPAAQKYKTYEGPPYVKADNNKKSLNDHFSTLKERVEKIQVKDTNWPSIKKDLLSRLDRISTQVQNARSMTDKKRAVLHIKNAKQEVGKISNIISTFEKVHKLEAVQKLQANKTRPEATSPFSNAPKKR